MAKFDIPMYAFSNQLFELKDPDTGHLTHSTSLFDLLDMAEDLEVNISMFATLGSTRMEFIVHEEPRGSFKFEFARIIEVE